MEIVFYFAPNSSAVPVACALSELDVPHRKVELDLAAGDQKQPDFLKLNPNGKVPTLVVDGTPMFEALAITQWLGDRFGVDRGVWPAQNDPARLAALSWTTWCYAEYCRVTHTLFMSTGERSPKALHHAAWSDLAHSELHELLSILDARLTGAPYLLGERFSLADLIVANMVMWSQLVGARTADHPAVSRWLDACAERPSIKAHWAQ